MDDTAEGQLTFWMDVLDEVVNGRLNGHACPFCAKAPLAVSTDAGRIRVSCASCGEFFEGRLP